MTFVHDCVTFLQDFSTPSLEGVVTRESREKRMRVYDHLDQYQIVERRQWEKRYIFYVYRSLSGFEDTL